MPRPARRLLQIAVCCLLLSAGAVALADELPHVDGIDIRGTQALSTGRLRDVMRTPAPSFWRPFRSTPFRRDILVQDLQRIEQLYADHGFLAAHAELADLAIGNDQGVRISIQVDEGPRTLVGAVAVTGNRTVATERILATIETATGAPYSPSRVSVDRQRILELYSDVGRPFTLVADSVVVDQLRASVEFRVSEAPPTRVADLRIDGIRATKQFVVRRELTFGRGDLLERREVVRSREQLLQTGFFRDVRFLPVTEDSALAPRLVSLQLLVSERKMGWIESGVGYNSSKQLRLTNEVGHRNVLGNAHRLVGRWRADFDLDALIEGNRPALDEGRVEVSFREPWLLSTRTIGTVSVFTELTREPDRTSEGVTEEQVNGVALSAERGISRPLRLRLTLENRWVTQQVVRSVADTEELEAGEEKFVTRSVALFAQHDLRDNPFDPSVGSLQTVLTELAGGALGGTANFLKLSWAGSWYRRVSHFVVAARLRTGWIHPFGTLAPGEAPIDKVPREERFRAGGATTVRGYPEDSLGPQTIEPGQIEPLTDRGLMTVVTNLELRFPLFWRFGGAVFLDGGNVWEEASDLNWSDFWPDADGASLQDYRYSVGGGVRLKTPVGPLRVDYGYGLVRGEPERLVKATGGGEWHFSLGQAF